ncbi:hypothetical protein [Rhodobacter calidifons]|uniref:Amino acid permease-like protein n=1 Tax=Rhodobacter calidifons TaxID=2715277 RepID=A0ABX0G4U3_9RHOB|nr:hypothetical protein [Rhodobacter calidifons]NHB75884.1 hypothetical protein [Rhodobacter calidifons]
MTEFAEIGPNRLRRNSPGLLAFAASYVAMSRHVINAGAFCAHAARGSGGGMGGRCRSWRWWPRCEISGGCSPGTGLGCDRHVDLSARVLIVLAIFAGPGPDPILNMFTWISQIGTLGVIGMMAITLVSVIAFFSKQGGGSPLSTKILPAIAGLIMTALFVYIFLNYGDLTGTRGGSLSWILPALIPLGGLIGYLLAMRLRAADPARFATMGQTQD